MWIRYPLITLLLDNNLVHLPKLSIEFLVPLLEIVGIFNKENCLTY